MLTYSEAAKLSMPKFWRGVAPNIVKIDDLYAMIPFARVQGASHTYVREGAELTANWRDIGGVITDTAQGFIEITTRIRTLADEVYVAGTVARSMDDAYDQLGTQVSFKLKAAANKFRDALINGNHPTATFTLAGVALSSTVSPNVGPNHKEGVGALTMVKTAAVFTLAYRAPGDTAYGTASADIAAGNPEVVVTSGNGYNFLALKVTSASIGIATVVVDCTISTSSYQFDGLRRLVSSSQVTDAAGATGDALSEDIMRQVIDKCLVDGAQKVLLMPSRTIRAFKALLAAHGGVAPAMIALPQFGIPSILSCDGVPILANDFIPQTLSKGGVSTLTEIWCVGLGESDASEALAPRNYAGLVALYGGSEAREAEGRSLPGLWAANLGRIQGKDAVGAAVGGDFGLALYSDKAAACYRHITN